MLGVWNRAGGLHGTRITTSPLGDHGTGHSTGLWHTSSNDWHNWLYHRKLSANGQVFAGVQTALSKFVTDNSNYTRRFSSAYSSTNKIQIVWIETQPFLLLLLLLLLFLLFLLLLLLLLFPLFLLLLLLYSGRTGLMFTCIAWEPCCFQSC